MQRLAKIKKLVAVVSKDKQGYGYNYADIVSILANITAGMEKYGVSLIPMVVPGTSDVQLITLSNTRVDKQGKAYQKTDNEMLFKADMVFKWVNNDNPEDFIEVPWTIVASQSDPSQAFGSGLTYCTRYFLTSYFQVAQVDGDVDAYRKKQKEAEMAEDKAIAESIVASLDEAVKNYLVNNPDKKDEVKEFISKYVKKANYLTITDPKIASKLYTDFNDTYINTES